MIRSFEELFSLFKFDRPESLALIPLLCIVVASPFSLAFHKTTVSKTAQFRIDTQYTVCLALAFCSVSVLASVLPLWYSQAALVGIIASFLLFFRDNRRFLRKSVEAGVMYEKGRAEQEEAFRRLSPSEREERVREIGGAVYKNVPLWFIPVAILVPYIIGLSFLLAVFYL